jgi:hypothetical protein
MPTCCLSAIENFWNFLLCSSKTQSRQSARLFLQSSELCLSHPLIRWRVFPLPLWFWVGAHLLAGEGGGVSQFERGDRNCDISGIYVLRGQRPSFEIQRRHSDSSLLFRNWKSRRCAGTRPTTISLRPASDLVSSTNKQ